MNFNIFWEGHEYPIENPGKDWITPLALLEQLNPEGRRDLIRVLCVNYRDELEQVATQVRRFEKVMTYPAHEGKDASLP